MKINKTIRRTRNASTRFRPVFFYALNKNETRNPQDSIFLARHTNSAANRDSPAFESEWHLFEVQKTPEEKKNYP